MKSSFPIATLLLAVAAAAPAHAQSQMSAGQFLAQAEPLLKKSKAALIFSSDARKLARMIGESAERNRAQHEAARKAGRKTTTCLPPKGTASVNSTELIQHLRDIPPAQRGQSFDQAFAGLMAKKYPCRS